MAKKTRTFRIGGPGLNEKQHTQITLRSEGVRRDAYFGEAFPFDDVEDAEIYVENGQATIEEPSASKDEAKSASKE